MAIDVIITIMFLVQDPRKPRIFAMTGKKADPEICQQAGMHGYLAKPVRLDQLVALIAACKDTQGA